MATKAVRHLVLDNEAVAALLSTTPTDARRARVIAAIAAANGRRWVPTAVRVEAGGDRTVSTAAGANRHGILDAPLDATGANRAVRLRAHVAKASVVDATVAVVAELIGQDGNVVEVLTSDVADMGALGQHVAATFDVRHV